MAFSQSIEAPLTLKDTAVLGGELNLKNGVGSGSVNFSVRHLVSPRGWFEVEVGAGSGPTLAFRGYRTLTKRIFFTGGTVLHFNSNEIRPGLIGSKFNSIFLFSAPKQVLFSSDGFIFNYSSDNATGYAYGRSPHIQTRNPKWNEYYCCEKYARIKHCLYNRILSHAIIHKSQLFP